MKTKARRLASMLVLTLMIGSMATGCSWSIGGRKESGVPAVQPTRGQELIDLKKARDQGAISEEEYQAAKKRIMND